LDVFDELSWGMWNLHRGSLEPLTTISETEDTVIVEIDLPLVRKRDVMVRLVEKGLEVEASLTRCVRFARWGTVQRSCEFRSFFKILPLPSPVVVDNAKATFRKGILRVELNKKKEAEYHIPIE
jgi:HSP20 family protein